MDNDVNTTDNNFTTVYQTEYRNWIINKALEIPLGIISFYLFMGHVVYCVKKAKNREPITSINHKKSLQQKLMACDFIIGVVTIATTFRITIDVEVIS